MTKSCSASNCNFIPIGSDEPTEATQSLVDSFDAYTETSPAFCEEFTKMMAETRKRSIIGMACTVCGEIKRIDF